MTNQEIKTKIKTEEYFVNMGPQHPAAHGVLRLLLTIDGEIIKNVEPDLGYIHRSLDRKNVRKRQLSANRSPHRQDGLFVFSYK